MRAASLGHAARGLARILLPLGLMACLTAVAACEKRPPLEPSLRTAPRHPIGPPPPPERAGAILETTSDREDQGRITPGPNSRISPTPDMSPRVEPSDRPDLPSSQREVEDLRRTLQQQRRYEREEPGPPAGTIDRRPGTIRTTPGTIEVPR